MLWVLQKVGDAMSSEARVHVTAIYTAIFGSHFWLLPVIMFLHNTLT